jgi:Mrp family chromosome partitioning ATPase
MKRERNMVITPSIESPRASDKLASPRVKELNPLAVHYQGEKLLRVSKTAKIDNRLVCLLKPRSSLAESYYRLRHSIECLRKEGQGVVVGVTSPGRGDGKTTTAINLAGALAQDPQASVLLVDLDLRQAGTSIREYLDISTGQGPGVIDWIQNPVLKQEQAGNYLPEFNMYLMSSGGKADAPYELLRSPRLDEFLADARQRFDYVILDTPQVLQLPDIQLLSRGVDGFLIVIRADHTPKDLVEETLDMMEESKVIGLVFNGAAP